MTDFKFGDGVSVAMLVSRIAARVRFERQRLGLSQAVFAERCHVPLRTYKRFELGQSDSLEVFVRVIVEFERVAALELLFPPRTIIGLGLVDRVDELARRRGNDRPR
jgi:transcriptional regulator with XRE-family HTH domain